MQQCWGGSPWVVPPNEILNLYLMSFRYLIHTKRLIRSKQREDAIGYLRYLNKRTRWNLISEIYG